jgi:hypothetical protein
VYQVILINNNIETTIHYPTSDNNSTHLDKLPLKEALSTVDSLSFNIYTNNVGYNKVYELTTIVKIVDVRDESLRFTGRVLSINEKMDSNGLFYKEVTCESALSFLNDSKQRANAFMTTNVVTFLTQILAIHNGKVEASKQIQIGNVDIVGSVAYSCNFETTLAAILKVKETLGGDIKVRETSGILYLDWLQSFDTNSVDVILGENMAEMVKYKDVTSFGSRIIPLGANNLTISSVNNGLDYLEDNSTRNIYGTIEKTVEYKDITDATELKNACIADLNTYTQPKLILETTALDLSFIQADKDMIKLGSNLHIVNPVMNVDAIYKVVGTDLDLLQPYNPKLTIANFPVKLTTAINDLRTSSVQNDGVYNGVQIGDSFGIRIVRSDNKVTTTLNATEGISIENQGNKVFFIDTSGNIVANDGTFNDITANNMTANHMIANEAKTSNTDDYIVLHDQYLEFFHNGVVRMRLGFTPSDINTPSIEFYGDAGLGGDPSTISTFPTGEFNFSTTPYVGSNDLLATQNWCFANFQPKS